MTISTTALGQYDAPRLAAALQRAEARIRQLEQESFTTTAENRKLLTRVASLEAFLHQKGLSFDEETENRIRSGITASHPDLAETTGRAPGRNDALERQNRTPAATDREPGEGDSRIQNLDRAIKAALSQHPRGTRTAREAELESLLWQALTCITRLRQENSALQQEIRWRDQLDAVPATVLSQNQKAALRVTLQDIGHHQAAGSDTLVQIESWHLCKKVGMSKQTFLEHLSYCAELGILRKQTEQVRDPDSQQVIATNYFVGTTELTAHPSQYQAVHPRNHGGTRARCKNPTCRSDRLQKRVIKHTIVICMECGEVQSDDTSDETVMPSDHLDGQVDSSAASSVVESTLENQDNHHTRPQNVNLTTYKTNVLNSQLDITERRRSEHDISLHREDDHEQPEADSPPVDAPSSLSDEQAPRPVCTQDGQRNRETNCTRDVHTGENAGSLASFEAAAALLVEIAGPAPQHIEMNLPDKVGRPRKYGPVYHAFTLEDARAHLAGKKTKGARLRRPDGMTRALCFDADTEDAWQALLDATRLLRMAGYVLLLEDSPVGRGGHLWIIYTGLVDARCAHRQVCQLAPMLAEIKECWPAKGNQVRLPGGRYVTLQMSEPCKLYDASGVRVAETGQEAAVALLTYQTPAEFVPDAPLDPEPDQMPPTQAGEVSPSLVPLPVEAADHPPVAQLIRWFNDTHSLESILPRQGDYANLPGQHHPSISYYPPDATHAVAYWYDHGGTHQHGDAFELYCLVSRQSKSQVLRDLRTEWRAHRRGPDPLTAASLGQPQTGIKADETRGGALSASQASASAIPFAEAGQETEEQGPYPPLKRLSFCCGASRKWSETQKHYVCRACLGTKE